MSQCGQTCSTAADLPGLSPPQRALLVLGVMVLVAVGKSMLTRVSILSTQHVEIVSNATNASASGGGGEHARISYTGIAFSALSCASTVLCAIVTFILEPGALGTPEASAMPSLLVITLFSSIDLGCTNAAIARLAAPLQQVLAALNPIFTITLESLLGCHLKHPMLYASTVTLTAGAALVGYAFTQERRLEYQTMRGVALMLTAVFSSAVKYVLLRKLSVRTRQSVGTISFVFWVEMLAFLALSTVALANGEFDTLVRSLTSAADPGALSVAIFISATLGGVRFLSEVYALRFVAAIDVSAAKSLASVLFVLLALTLPSSAIDADAPQFAHIRFDDPSNPYRLACLVAGLAIVAASITTYWVVQRRLGPRGLIVRRYSGSCAARLGSLLGDDAHEGSDVARAGATDLDSGLRLRRNAHST